MHGSFLFFRSILPKPNLLAAISFSISNASPENVVKIFCLTTALKIPIDLFDFHPASKYWSSTRSYISCTGRVVFSQKKVYFMLRLAMDWFDLLARRPESFPEKISWTRFFCVVSNKKYHEMCESEA